MDQAPGDRHRSRRRGFRAAAWTLLLAGGAAGVLAQTPDCIRQNNGRLDCATPWTAPPQSLWGELRPAEGSNLPVRGSARRDVTDFNEFLTGENVVPWFMSLDIENGYVFVAAGYRLQIWNPGIPKTPGPVAMTLLGEVKGQGSGWRNFPFLYQGETSTPLFDVDAPAGIDSIVAIVGIADMGISIVETSDKSSPALVYQDSGRSATEVYAARIGGVDYAFVAQTAGQSEPTGSALLAYNMTEAVRLGRCHSPDQTCPNVRIGRLGNRSAAYVDGVGNFVVYSAGTSGGYQILDVSNPADAKVRLTGLAGKPTYGVALWSDGGKYYLGVATVSAGAYLGQIYDVSCIAAAGTCPSSPPLLSSIPIRQGSARIFLTFSRSSLGPYLHYGTDDMSGYRTWEREFLVDVTDPTQPRVINPPGYFGWIHNFNGVWPGRGKFFGSYFFRAGHTVMDAHRLFQKPAADFTWSPPAIYPGMPVVFTDTSAGESTSWDWTGDGAAAVPPPL